MRILKGLDSNSPCLGRFVVASRDIKPLEIILEDTAVCTGMCMGTRTCHVTRASCT